MTDHNAGGRCRAMIGDRDESVPKEAFGIGCHRTSCREAPAQQRRRQPDNAKLVGRISIGTVGGFRFSSAMRIRSVSSASTRRRGDGGPAVEHEVAVVVAVPAGNRRGVRHVGGDLPERDDRIPAHRRRAVAACRFLQPVRPVEQQIRDHHTIGSDGCCRNSTRVPSHGAAVSPRISSASVACENRTVRPLS